ncbi:hypothetical protein I79_010967 [Cricetulus griseus]|uniref:Uncharacterized protein n=1 Tax=Cricetulus griseus TaxID=10029 RepID=G3HJW5_CRIGR|nr:hypothetical protein I79_010967 [Cricetulus griseus]
MTTEDFVEEFKGPTLDFSAMAASMHNHCGLKVKIRKDSNNEPRAEFNLTVSNASLIKP